jgi:rSAM/selenodomain-associated transferase 2
MNQFNVSVVVPVFNEAEQVTSLVYRLTLLKEYVKDIIVVDGGSDDGCDVTLAKQFTVIKSQKGRANQMNAGAQHAKGTWLIFLHADTQFNSSQLRAMVDQASLHQWGRFNVQLDAKGLGFRIIEWFINQRSRLTGVATGDQCIFVRKRFFDSLNGFKSIPLMEDVDFSKRAKKLAPPKCLKESVITSARRWQKNGLLKTVILMWQLRYAFWRGVSPETLADRYR